MLNPSIKYRIRIEKRKKLQGGKNMKKEIKDYNKAKAKFVSEMYDLSYRWILG
ncbi:hypothetical protein LCGC14_2682420 [marine sediment metagenome]|uniref:Uncharacterized protein n=1 Tax=marine sediment metagenome TaxID=412755 RepID=A0A0F9CCR0_9ZZZZ